MAFHSLENVSYELVVDRFSVDEGEYCVYAFSSSFLQHFSSILVRNAVESPSSKIKEGSDELDRYMIVKELEAGQSCELSSNSEFP